VGRGRRRKAVSATETGAEAQIIDLVAPDVPTLLRQIDGRTVRYVLGKGNSGPRTRRVSHRTGPPREDLASSASNIAYI